MDLPMFVSGAVRRATALCFVLALALSSVWADGVNKKVRFAKGKSATVIKGAVVRGDRDRYTVGASSGQKMTVSISSLEKNAVFQIYRPGETDTLEGAGEGEDATRWSGELPDDGNYVIVVGGTRGNATYSLRIAIK